MKKFYHIIIGLLCLSSGYAQSVYNNGSIISIQPNTILSITDSLVNNGEIINNGDLQVAGTWINNGIYDAGQGKLTLTSSAQQVVNHNAQSFSQLVITGGGEKIFQADITINDELSLTDGILVSANGAKIILEPNAIFSGASDNSYIDGPVVIKGSSTQTAPVGTNNIYLPIRFNDIRGGSPELQITLVEPNPNTSVNPSLSSVSPVRYWDVRLLSGTYDGTYITLPIRNENILNDINEAAVSYTSDLQFPFQSIGQVLLTGDTNSGSVSGNKSAKEGFFAIGKLPPLETIDIFVYNAVSPNGDGLHDFLKVVNIEYFPENEVKIYNRWGDLVFETKGYNNIDNFFKGDDNVRNAELNDGTYFYSIDKKDGPKSKKIKTGFFILRR